MGKQDLNSLRDCVKEAFEKGCQRGLEFHKMRHAIIVELQRLGYSPAKIKNMLNAWNKKCEKPLGLSELRIKLFGYVDWVFKNTCRISCKALEDYCIGKEKCLFYLRTTRRNRDATKELPFDINELDKFLTERFKADGYVMMLIVKALRFIQQERATGEVMIVGLRDISSVINDRDNHNIHYVEVDRKIKFLLEEGVLEQVIKGKRGNFSGEANGYRFLAWRHPKATEHPPY